MRRVALAVALVALAAGAAALLLGSRGDSAEPRPEITREYLVRLGLRLGPPDPDQPMVIARERAERVARSAAPESPVLGSVLATCYDSDADVGYPCWVVAHDPQGRELCGPPGRPECIPAAYSVSVVDSRTGRWVGGQMGGGPGAGRFRDRNWAREVVEQAILEWSGSRASCRDDVRPDFRGRPAFGCTVGTGPSAETACYAVVGDNLFRLGCSGARTDSGRLVHRG